MGATCVVGFRIDRWLDAISADVADLARWAAEWERLPDGERASLSLEWDHMMLDYVPSLVERYRAGDMTDTQPAHFATLRQELDAAQPLIERLQFCRQPELPSH